VSQDPEPRLAPIKAMDAFRFDVDLTHNVVTLTIVPLRVRLEFQPDAFLMFMHKAEAALAQIQLPRAGTQQTSS
jgi:hypothetical protein